MKLTELPIIVADCETTGLNKETDEVIELGCVRVNLEDRRHKILINQLIDPQRSIPPESSGVNGISNAMVRGCPTWSEITPQLREIIGPDVLVVCHNAFFDAAFLKRGLSEDDHPIAWIDTLRLVRHAWPKIGNHKLGTMCYALNIKTLDKVVGYEEYEPHRAAYDAFATANILCEAIEELEIETVDQLIEWSDKPALLHYCPLFKYRDCTWNHVPKHYLTWAHSCRFEGDLGYTIDYWVMKYEELAAKNQADQAAAIKDRAQAPTRARRHYQSLEH